MSRMTLGHQPPFGINMEDPNIALTWLHWRFGKAGPNSQIALLKMTIFFGFYWFLGNVQSLPDAVNEYPSFILQLAHEKNPICLNINGQLQTPITLLTDADKGKPSNVSCCQLPNFHVKHFGCFQKSVWVNFIWQWNILKPLTRKISTLLVL